MDFLDASRIADGYKFHGDPLRDVYRNYRLPKERRLRPMSVIDV